MTGFVSNQKHLLEADLISKFDYWSWEDRGLPTIAAFHNQAEAMNVVAAWRGDQHDGVAPQGRDNGRTYNAGLQMARKVGPRFLLAGTFNEWGGKSEEPSAEVSKDIEPSEEFGIRYLEILRRQAESFKNGQ